MDRLAILISGVLFGTGVTISGMVNPTKVLNFMDIFGQWDPTLLLVMGAGLIVTFAGYRFIFARPAPLFAPEFNLPASQLIDAKLLGGAALFGLGWGMTGFCPGPAVASLVFGRTESVMFVAAMAIGMVATRHLVRAMPAEA
jgi:uncharacterized protein